LSFAAASAEWQAQDAAAREVYLVVSMMFFPCMGSGKKQVFLLFAVVKTL
jgi:hypothetical protein